MNAYFDHLIKLIMVGDSSVGKTCILNMYVDKVFHESYVSTIGVDFKIRNVVSNGQRIKIQMWDTAGQERFRGIINSYYRKTDIIVLVFDVTNRRSFLNLEKWLTEIKNNIYEPPSEYRLVLFGNKSENQYLMDVTQNEIDEFCLKHHIPYYPVTAKNFSGIEKAMTDTINESVKIKNAQAARLAGDSGKNKDNIDLCAFEKGKSSKCC